MKVVITGGTGFIGQRLARRLLDLGELTAPSGAKEQIDELLLFDQAVPDPLPPALAEVGPGSRVRVPLGRRPLVGVGMAVADAVPRDFDVKEILEALDVEPVLSPELLASLYRMGHGDELILADAHFPGESLGRPVVRALEVERLTRSAVADRAADLAHRVG